MTTKDGLLLLHDKSFITSHNDNKNHQYFNLNLNQNHNCLDKSFVHSNSKSSSTNNIKNSVSFFDEKYGRKKSLQSFWNKSNLNKHVFVEDENDKKKLNKDKTSPNNSSTLSLHISAYENSVEDYNSNDNTVSIIGNKESTDSIKKWNKIDATSVNQNLFEFPRQQKDDRIDPAIMQFKASQQLLKPNQSGTSKSGRMPSEKDSTKLPSLMDVNLKHNSYSSSNPSHSFEREYSNYSYDGGEERAAPQSKKYPSLMDIRQNSYSSINDPYMQNPSYNDYGHDSNRQFFPEDLRAVAGYSQEFEYNLLREQSIQYSVESLNSLYTGVRDFSSCLNKDPSLEPTLSPSHESKNE